MKSYLKIAAFILFVMVVVYLYARIIEPNLLNINYENITTNLISKKCDKIKILQFSDTHLSDYFSIEDLKRVVDKINGENPDIVIFTGDLIDHYNNYNYKGDIDHIWETLKQIKAPLGKYAVYGNHDYGGGGEAIYRKIMDKSGFTTLVNSNIMLKEYNLNIIGMDDSIFGKIDKDKLISCIDNNFYNVVISHEPDIIDFLLEYNIDLFLSGHSHGGQVNIPIISKNILPPLGEKYVRGLYKFENARNTVLYVNVGIGTSQVPFRFMAVPEMAIFTLRYK